MVLIFLWVLSERMVTQYVAAPSWVLGLFGAFTHSDRLLRTLNNPLH